MPCFCLSRFTLLLLFLYFLPLPFPPSSRGHESIKKEGGERGLRFVACACVCQCCVENGVKFISSSDIKTHHPRNPPTATKCSVFRSNDIFSHLPLHIYTPLTSPPFFTNPPPGWPAACMYARMYACMHEIVGTCIACFALLALLALLHTHVKYTSDSL